MEIIVKNSFDKKYLLLTKHISEEGTVVEPRGKTTKEIRPVTIVFENPIKRIISLPGRNINPFFLVAEILWILSGKEDVETLSLFNENISQFSDDGFFFHGAYGSRLRHFGKSFEIKTSILNSVFENDVENDKKILLHLHKEKEEINIDQLKQIFLLLKKENNTRRAVASIWNPIQDLNKDSKDLPCNDLLMFKIRDNKLDLTVINRSNDLHWGLPTNYFQFSFILEVMSYCLGDEIEIGKQIHYIDSLHIYLDNPITERLLKENSEFLEYGSNLFFDDDENEITNIYEKRIEPVKFSLNENYLIYNNNEDLFEKTFSAIKDTYFCLENFETLFNTFFLKVKNENEDVDILEIFSSIFYKMFVWEIVKKKSVYLYSLVDFTFSYFLYKKAISLFYNKECNKKLFSFLLTRSIFSLFSVIQKDLRESGILFYINLITNRLEKLKDTEMKENIRTLISVLETLKKVSIFFKV